MRKRSLLRPFTVAVLLTVLTALPGRSQPAAVKLPDWAKAPPNWKQKTLGGVQIWSDQEVFHQWRIQRNDVTGHFRLLDGDDRRHAWGALDHCRDKLDRLRRDRQLPPMDGTAVIVMHGLLHGHSSMRKIARYLDDYSAYEVLNISYASTRRDIAGHARSLGSVVASLEGIDRIHFVAHSMGNLVIRHYLADQLDRETGRLRDTRIGRVVMLGPPNDGAQLAKRYGNNALYEWVAGDAGRQLGENWEQLQQQLATPPGQFAIIAGGWDDKRLSNPLISGADDLVVRVEETRLAGAHDFAVLPVVHMIMMNDPTVQRYTLSFLQHGYFVAEDQRKPIPKL